MNRNQKIFLTSIILIAIIATSIVAYTMTAPQATTKLKVVTTFYPLTYLAQQIGGEQIEITQLIPNNTEIHGWEPSASHIMAAEDAKIIIYNGAGLDHWMKDDVLPALSNAHDRTVVESTSALTLILNQEHEHEGESGEEEHDHGVYDPHTWVSPYMAKLQAENIYNALVTVDPQHESYYTQRWTDLKAQLEQLDTAYLNGLSNASQSYIFVSHEAYGYLADRYGFTQHGVIGLSADEQPSATTIATIVEEMQEHHICALYVDPVYSNEYINTIKTEVQTQTGQTVNVLKLYLMLGPVDNMDLLAQMHANLESLQTGLEAT
ncbi:MAG: metal ABC transporter substrate-binding protein [Candidatus Bathyarchaeia archaeon]|jgi:zinc transport system substrate-binding protein